MKQGTKPIVQHSARIRPNRANLAQRLALVGVTLAACSTAPGSGDVSVTLTPITTAVATPTEIVWFPPTETELPPMLAVQDPTPERRPGIGEPIFEDEMTSSDHWNAAAAADSAATVSARGLTISVQPGADPVVTMHRSAIVDDMYMEVTARPSLCRDRDSYGLVFRAPNDVAHYRFAAICDGTTAAQRMSLGAPHVLQPPTASGDVPIGAPGEVRLGVWASGPELRFFLNDRYQFTATDRNYLAGGVGVFVQPGGDTAVVVTFMDFAVYRISTQNSGTTPAP